MKIKIPFLTQERGHMTRPRERLSYWTYFIGQNVYYNITAYYIATYLLMLGVDPIRSGVVLGIVKVWDAINDPIFGYIFDKVKFKSGQKSLPWLRIAVLGIPFVTIALFSIPSFLSETGMLIWFGVAYVLWDTVYTLTDVPAYAMLNTMTDDLQERNVLLSINRVFSGVGMMLYNVVFIFTVTDLDLSPAVAVTVFSVFSALTMVPLLLFCKERNYRPGNQDESFSPRQMLRYLGKNKYLLRYYGGYMATDALKTSGAVQLFVCFYLFENANFAVLLNILGIAPGAIAALIAPAMFKRFDKFKTLFWCNIVNILLGFLIYFAGYENKLLFAVLTVIRAVPLSLAGILAFMFTPDCAEYGEYTSGINAKGITFAIQTFSVKITAAVSNFLALFLLGIFSWVSIKADSFEKLAELNIPQPPEALNGLWIVYALVPVIGMVISTFFYMSYHLNDADVQVMSRCNSGEISRVEAEKLLSRKY